MTKRNCRAAGPDIPFNADNTLRKSDSSRRIAAICRKAGKYFMSWLNAMPVSSASAAPDPVAPPRSVKTRPLSSKDANTK